MEHLSPEKSKTFPVTAYQPYIVDFVWYLEVPGASIEDAIEKVAVVMRDDDSLMPKEWVLQSGYDNDGTEMPSLHGHPGWEVTDKQGNEETAARPDKSKQRAFVWSYDHILMLAPEINPTGVANVPRLTHDRFGVLIAEDVSGVLMQKPEPAHLITAENLRDGVTGQEFWCAEECRVYRVLWSFCNPQ